MHDERTATLRLPLPHPDNALDEDVERLRAALTALDTESGDVRALFATLSGLLESAADTATWAGVSGKPEAFPPATHKASHVTGGADALTPADIGAQPAGSYQPAGDYALASDARLTDARPPTAHAASHQHGGTDEIATATPAANAIPKADANGKLDAWVTPVVDITGNAATADKLSTARTITLTGDLTGSFSFDGSEDVSVKITNNVAIDTTPKPSTLLIPGSVKQQVSGYYPTVKLPSGGTYGYSVTLNDRSYSSTSASGGTVVATIYDSASTTSEAMEKARTYIENSSGTYWRIA